MIPVESVTGLIDYGQQRVSSTITAQNHFSRYAVIIVSPVYAPIDRVHRELSGFGSIAEPLMESGIS